MNNNHPIVLGLAGRAGTGKTVTADGLSPMAYVFDVDEDNLAVQLAREEIEWIHTYFALPITRIVTARRKISGEREYDRQCYEIYDVLYDLFGKSVLFGSLPPYDEFVELVEHLAAAPCPQEGKARQYMQLVGDLCRAYDNNCFVKWVERSIRNDWNAWRKTNDEIDKTTRPCGFVVSDVRYENEAALVHNHPNGVLVKFVADDDVLEQRLLERDGVPMSAEQKNHSSESLTIPDEWFDFVIDSTELSVADQVAYTKDSVDAKLFGGSKKIRSLARFMEKLNAQNE